MRIARGLRAEEPNDFEIYTNDSLKSAFVSIAGVIRIGAFVISTIALLAAGIGIMNIMLVSVTERTKEIGVRKSIGARNRDILRQFLTEAVFISEAGGILGHPVGGDRWRPARALAEGGPDFPVRLGDRRVCWSARPSASVSGSIRLTGRPRSIRSRPSATNNRARSRLTTARGHATCVGVALTCPTLLLFSGAFSAPNVTPKSANFSLPAILRAAFFSSKNTVPWEWRFRRLCKNLRPSTRCEVAHSLAEAEDDRGGDATGVVLARPRSPPSGEIAFFSKLKAHYPEARVLVIAPGTSRELRTERGTAGAIQFLEKPFDLAEFGAAVQALLGPWGAAVTRRNSAAHCATCMSSTSCS